MLIEIFYSKPLFENSYIIYNNNTKSCVIIDPGSSINEIINFIDKNSLIPLFILNTHGHFDHTIFNKKISELYNIDILAHKDELHNFKNGKTHAKIFGLDIDEIEPPSKYIDQSSPLSFDDIDIKVIETPGHTLGSLSFYIERFGVIFTGDTLFKESIGRTDLSGGDYNSILLSIKKLFSLPDSLKVYPGHGPSTTIKHEKEFNFINRDL